MRQHAPSQVHWRQLVDDELAETDRGNLGLNMQDAEDAVMDEIEDSFQTASPVRRHSLVNAINALRDTGRPSERPRWKAGGSTTKPPQAA